MRFSILVAVLALSVQVQANDFLYQLEVMQDDLRQQMYWIERDRQWDRWERDFDAYDRACTVSTPTLSREQCKLWLKQLRQSKP